MRQLPPLVGVEFGIAVTALLVSQVAAQSGWIPRALSVLDGFLLVTILAELVVGLRETAKRGARLRHNGVSFGIAIGFLFFVVYTHVGPEAENIGAGAPYLLLISRTVLLLIPSLTRVGRLTGFVRDIVSHPAQTVTLSFVLIILLGTLVLMLPFTAADGTGLSLVDALFTATSAVCVTGLIVVDTATVYTVWGQLAIMILIQCGGLGIMVLALFTFMVRRQAVSVESKVLLSYMLSESRMTELSTGLRRIIYITFGLEAVGAVLLFFFFQPVADGFGHGVLLAAFHAVSAFCNAGFALFTTSLEQFHDHVGVNLVVISLIVTGGISFGVLTNLFQHLKTSVLRVWRRRQIPIVPLSVNTRAVLSGTGIMLLAAFLLFYALEYNREMKGYATGLQYLGAFFQSVTLRTAGFNTIPTGSLTIATYMMMMTFMFIGGASGSTAGGIKINNAAVIVAHIKTTRRSRNQTLLFGHAVSDKQIATAFTVLVFGLMSVVGGTFLLAITEDANLTQILFEAVSAFGTVGLSTGITSELSWMGRVTVTILMFIGRVGPLTLLAASIGRNRQIKVAYPSADVAIG